MPAPTPESLIDKVNDLDETIGLVKKQDIFDLGVGFRVVHILIRNESGDLLIEHLSAKAPRSPLLLGSTSAGYLNFGESYAEGARRRLLEERGTTELPLTKLGCIRMPDQGATKFIGLFMATVPDGTTLWFNEEDTKELRWLSCAEIDSLLAEDESTFTTTFPYVYRLYKAAMAGDSTPPTNPMPPTPPQSVIAVEIRSPEVGR